MSNDKLFKMVDMELTAQQEQLLAFVKEQHGNQKRKYTFEPYWYHLISVASIVNEYIKEPGYIEIALCHDLLEDTECTENRLSFNLFSFGYTRELCSFICKGVKALTDEFTHENFPLANRGHRKKCEAERLEGIRPEYQSIKYADLIDNTYSISEHDPNFARVYLKEKKEILDKMTKGNGELLIRCLNTLENANGILNDV